MNIPADASWAFTAIVAGAALTTIPRIPPVAAWLRHRRENQILRAPLPPGWHAPASLTALEEEAREALLPYLTGSAPASRPRLTARSSATSIRRCALSLTARLRGPFSARSRPALEQALADHPASKARREAR